MEDNPSRWNREHRPGGWRLTDGALAVGFFTLLVTEIVPNPDMTPQLLLVAVSVVMTLPLAWRRRAPTVVAVSVCAGHLVANLVATGEFPPQLSILPVLVAVYSAASWTRGRTALAVGAATAVMVVAAWIVTDDGQADDFWPWLLWGGAWATGTFVRRRGDVAAHHAARAAVLEVEASVAAEESAQAERDRIARELHDVVAHAVSVMVVQAGAERLRLGADAGPTREALLAIEDSGRTALAELRTMLGVLRDGTDEEPAPLPGLTALPALVERLRHAGLPVEMTSSPDSLVRDDESSVGLAAGLAVYRIVQESLTNVVRHVGMVPTLVDLRLDGDSMELTVTNGVRAHGAGSHEILGGRGLPGMRERVHALGGWFEAGEQADEFVVRARIPLRRAPVRA